MLESSNPFAAPSSLPYQFPPFNRIRLEHYRPAFDAGVGQQRDQVRAIAASAEPPTFTNTIEAMERSGRLLERVLGTFFNVAHSMATEEMQQLEAEIAPRYSRHRDEILLDASLFARIDSLHARAGELDLSPEQHRVLQRYHTDFLRAGAALPAAEQDRLRAINEELTELSTEFGRRALAERNDVAVHVTDRTQLAGLDDDQVEAAQRAASERGLDGYLLTLVAPTIQPAMASLTDRETRRRLHEASTSRGMRGGEHDSRALVSRITALRAERAGLLGFDHHAAYFVADQTAASTAAVLGMLGEMTGPAMANLDAERAAIEKAMAEDGVDGPVQPWDWAFYAARGKAQDYQLDPAAMRPFFELDRVLHDGVFYAANRLYGITFAERHDLPLYHEDVRAFDVHDHDGSVLGLFVCDWFARPIKRGGAWMSSFVEQSRLHGTRPAVVVCLNVPKPVDGKPALMTADEVRTAFHEFGHALHGLFSDADYPRLAGTNAPRDFVEFPSQVNEMWAWSPEVIEHYARHHQTGDTLDHQVVERFLASRESGAGFRHRGHARRCAARPGVASAGALGRPRPRRRSGGLRASRPGPAQDRLAARAAPLPQWLLLARVHHRLRRGLLRLSVERGPGRGHGGLVRREWWAATRERRPLPRRAALPRRNGGPGGGLHRGAGPAAEHRAPDASSWTAAGLTAPWAERPPSSSGSFSRCSSQRAARTGPGPTAPSCARTSTGCTSSPRKPAGTGSAATCSPRRCTCSPSCSNERPPTSAPTTTSWCPPTATCATP
jgi:peptidyl-dipeptidase Dcp